MSPAPRTWTSALRALAMACTLIAAVAFVAGNFVLVDIHLLGWSLETRLAWAVVLPAALSFTAGVLYARTRALSV